MFLGIDGGGTKTAFLILSPAAKILATASGATTYHPAVGLEGVRAVLREGIAEVLAGAGIEAAAIRRAFVGLPAYGEDPRVDPELALAPSVALTPEQYVCGNDVVCGWAGALACADGISVTAGTGSIAYGEYQGRCARAGGWGEVFGDEGSAYWIGREGLAAFARMSDGRSVAGPLLELVRRHFRLAHDLDLAGRINDPASAERAAIAQLSPVVATAALSGDVAARDIFERAGSELATIVQATRTRLEIADAQRLPVSYAGGVFASGPLILAPFCASLNASSAAYLLQPPLLSPVVGAALYASRLHGHQFSREDLQALVGGA
jgi:N-acetylglucosamine kinase-like BadF-type ATPase